MSHGNKGIKKPWLSELNRLRRKPKPEPKLCECGICEQYAKPGKRFVIGHGIKGKKRPDLSERNKQNSGEKSPTFGKPNCWRGKKNSAASSKIKILWKDPDYVQSQMKSRGAAPNKIELRFEKFLNFLYPNEWKYVGDGQLIINGRCPDFVNINGKKQIIELYGDYWHRGQDPQDRIKIFKPFGYETLVIWEKELKDIELLKMKIEKFGEHNEKSE